MAVKAPWHSKNQAHYHNNTNCGPGSEIPPANRIEGTGGKPICADCRKLNDAAK